TLTKTLALVGLASVSVLSLWQLQMLTAPRASRSAVYWVVQLGRWPLLYAGGTVGLVGLYALARRGRPLPSAWFAVAYAIGVGGALGLGLPLWYRILLFAQLPLTLGVAQVAANVRARSVRYSIAVCVIGVLAVKIATLVA